MTTRAHVDRRALAGFLKTDSAANAALDGTTIMLAQEMENQSPVGTGYYQDRFSIRKFPLSRRIRNRDPFAHLVEWGSIHNIAYAPMRRAVRALGMRLHERPKGSRT